MGGHFLRPSSVAAVAALFSVAGPKRSELWRAAFLDLGLGFVFGTRTIFLVLFVILVVFVFVLRLILTLEVAVTGLTLTSAFLA